MSGQTNVEQIATERVETALRGLADAERAIARNHERRRAYRLAAVHDRAAELYMQRIAAAPGIWNGRDRLIAAAEDAMKEADRG